MKRVYVLGSLIGILCLALLGRALQQVRERFTLIDHGRCLQKQVPISFSIGDVRNGSLWLAPRSPACGRVYARIDGISFAVTKAPEGWWEVQRDDDGEPILQGL